MGPIWAIILFIIGGFVPSITGIILTAIYEGKAGVKELFKKSIQVKIALKWFVIIILISFYLAFSLIVINAILGHKFEYSQFWIHYQLLFL